jgi:hypothetical protein
MVAVLWNYKNIEVRIIYVKYIYTISKSKYRRNRKM